MAEANADVIVFDNPSHFSPEEMKYCREIESRTLDVLLEHGILDRCFWIIGNGPSGRVIKLVGKPGTILQLEAAKISDVPQSEIIRRLHKDMDNMTRQE